jgi:magnesium transporter
MSHAAIDALNRIPAHGRSFSHESAGSRMTPKVPTVFEGQLIGDIQSLVLHCIHVFKSIDYVYVLSPEGAFVGVMSIKDVYGTEKKRKVGDVCRRTSLVSVHPDASQERVVYLALKNNIKAVPVVDDRQRFLGVVLNDTILTILYKEAHEDLLHLAGITHPHAVHSNVIDAPLLTSFKHRMPWLVIGLAGGMLTASVIGLFEGTLERNILLASFIPLVVYMSSAVGMQMQACVIRDLALEQNLRFGTYLVRQTMVTGLIAMAISVIMYAATVVLHGDHDLGLIMGLSMAVAILSSVVSGLITPYAFSRFKLDPADASGPIATIAQDLLSVVIYFGIATAMLG